MRLRAFRGRRRWLLFWLLIVAILVLPILLFLLVAFCPRLLDQGPEWFTLPGVPPALHRHLCCAGLLELADRRGRHARRRHGRSAFAVAWVVLRTDVCRAGGCGPASMFALLLAPSYLIALGWERLLEPAGVLELLGWVPAAACGSVFYGPVGVIVRADRQGHPVRLPGDLGRAARAGRGVRGTPSRVHGGGRLGGARVVRRAARSGVWSALAIVFAESVSDFGVAATLANDAHFPVATFTLYNAVAASRCSSRSPQRSAGC